MNNQGSGSGSGTFREEASAIGDRVSGNVKDAYGAVTGNESVEREVEAQANYGAQRQSNNRVLTGMFRDRESAERAYGSVTSRGYTNDDVDVMMSDDTRSKYFSDADANDGRGDVGHAPATPERHRPRKDSAVSDPGLR